MASEAQVPVAAVGRPRRDGVPVALVMGTALTLSGGYLGSLALVGLLPSGLAELGPGMWAAPLAGLGATALVLTDRLWAWWTASLLIPGLIGVGVTLYGLLLAPGLQTAIGWFQNDVCIGLLVLAEYLCVQHLRSH
jgi:hypothetical protein